MPKTIPVARSNSFFIVYKLIIDLSGMGESIYIAELGVDNFKSFRVP